MKKLIRLFFVLFLLWTMDCGLLTANAAVPHLINYESRLTDTSGVPLDGLYNITFRLYDAETAGNLLWQGTYNSVSVSKGVFSILLGDVNDSGFNFAALAFDKPYWLEIKVDDDVLSPRQLTTSAGYAIRADTADNVKDGSVGIAALSSFVTMSLVPKGAIVMWSGSISSIPQGWALCDGNSGTPDLRDRFIIGATQDIDGIAKSNLEGSLKKSGGSLERPPHTSVVRGDGGGGQISTGGAWIASGLAHQHEFIPPYYALAYIMKL